MSLHVFLSLMRAELCSYIGRGTAGSHGLYMPNFNKYRDYSAERVLKYKLPPLLIYMILSLSDFLFRYISTLLDTNSYDSSQNYINSAIKKIKRHIIQRSTREIQFSCGVNSKTEAPSLSKYFHLLFAFSYLKFLKRQEYQTILSYWESCMQVKKQQLELDLEQLTGYKLGKTYDKAVHCHPAYLTYMQSTSFEMPGWMNHKLESRLQGEISTSDMQMIPLWWQKMKRN